MRKAVISAAVLALAITSAPALASGSGSGSGATRGGGGFGASGFDRISEEERLLRRGKSQVRKRITCKKCEYHDRLNQQTALEIAQAVREGKFDLKERDRSAVLFFLRQRYGA